MPFTPEELEEIKAGNLNALAPALELGLVVRTKAQEEAFQTNFREKVKDEVVGSEDLPAYKNIEAALEKLTGQKRNDNEKATEFLTRVVGPLQKTVAEKEAEIKALKDGGAEENNPFVAALRKELDEAKHERDKAVIESKKKVDSYIVNGEIDRMRQEALAIPMDVPDDVKPDIVEARLSRWLAENEIRNGESGIEVFNKKDNRVEVDTTTLQRRKATDFVESIFSGVKAKEAGKGGTGTGGTGADGGAGSKSTYLEAKSKIELHEALQKDGYTTNSAEFQKLYDETLTGYQQKNNAPMPLRSDL